MDTIIIVILLLASVIGLTFIIERGLALRAAKVIPPPVLGALEACRSADDLPMLRNICQQHPSALSRLLLLAERNRHWSREDNASAIETSARQEVSRLERGLVVLEIIVGAAPLLGLVGTIYGIMAVFSGMSSVSGSTDNAQLQNGIATALHATFLGLVTAIPSLVGWNYFNRKVESLAVEMAALCDTFLHQIYRGEEVVVSGTNLKTASRRR
jgi:biopolymer transport protein ExbB